MESNKNFLGTEPIKKLLFKLALPTVLAQLINMLYNIVDRIYIGHMPGDGALALTGIGVCMPVILILSAFAALVSSGGAPRASIHMGKQDNESAESILGNCFTLLIIIALALTAVLLIFGERLLMLFGASENTIGYAADYLRIYAIGTIFVQLTLGLNSFITAQGYARVGMLTVLIGALCNIALDPLFIYGFGMGVQGAALATILSQAVSCVWCVIFLASKRSQLRIRRRHLRLKGKVILPCVALGLATFIMQASESVLSVCFNSSLLKYGGDMAVGAMTICTSVMQFAMLPMQGIGQGAQPISSYNFGAGRADRVRETFMLLAKLCLGYAAVLWALVLIFPKVFAGIFTSDSELLAYATKVLPIYCGALLLMGAQIACQLTFVSIGNAPCSIIVAVVRKFVLLIPMIYIMPHILTSNPTVGVYLAEPVSDIIAVCFTIALFFTQFRKALRSMEQRQG